MKKLSAKEVYESGFFIYHEYYHANSLSLNKELVSHLEASKIHQFKVIKELILKHQTLFYNTDEFKIEADYNSVIWLNYFKLKKATHNTLSSLLDAIILNKDAFDLFSDAKLLSQIKPLIQEAMRDEKESKIVHEVFLDSLYNIKATQFLLDCGVNVNYMNNYGLSALMIATHPSVTKTLIKYGADISLKNTMPNTISTDFLGMRLFDYHYLMDKNAYEMHSLLKHDSVLKVLKEASKENITHSEHFMTEYEKLKQNPTAHNLLLQIRKENAVVLDNLNEFKKLIIDNHDEIINFVAQNNKPVWLEKMIDTIGKEALLKNHYIINNYLELALEKNSYQSAHVFLEKGIYELDRTFDSSVLMKINDDKFMQSVYQIVPNEVTYLHALKASSLTVIETLINQKKECEDDIFEVFCKTLEGHMNYSDYHYDLKARDLKTAIIDCLAIIVKKEENLTLKEARLELLIKSATEVLPYNTQKEEQYLKTKIQKLIKYFPEKKDEMITHIQSKFPVLASELEQKSLQKIIAPMSEKSTKRKKEETNQETTQIIKPRKNKI